MNREECYMSFSEALESYLQARANAAHFGPGTNRESEQETMRVAAAHMDALTTVESKNDIEKRLDDIEDESGAI